jgi:hypothetical protein
MNAHNAPPLDHMDRLSRNLRLYEDLVSRGLYVEPIWAGGEHGGIDYLRVSVDLIRDQQFQG